MKNVFRKLGIILSLSVMAVGGFLFSGETEAFAADPPDNGPCIYEDIDHIELVNGFVIDQTISGVRYSFGTQCHTRAYELVPGTIGVQYPTPIQPSVAVKYRTWDGSTTDSIMFYLEEWNPTTNNWVQKAHWGDVANNGKYVIKVLTSLYNGEAIKTSAGIYYRIYVSNSDGASTFSVSWYRPDIYYFEDYRNGNITAQYR
jgi:hypothetical protein